MADQSPQQVRYQAIKPLSTVKSGPQTSTVPLTLSLETDPNFQKLMTCTRQGLAETRMGKRKPRIRRHEIVFVPALIRMTIMKQIYHGRCN